VVWLAGWLMECMECMVNWWTEELLDCKMLCEGSGQLVMKSGAWKMGEDEVNTVLVNKEGEEIAARETTWEKQVSGSRL